ncbi:MAG: SMC family ATPase [Bacteroidota bacterium]|nr:SMC family ATPase [Bacteroidota bacterium]
MIPISLTLKGLYSYKESQIIDFKSLTSSGLFGIFGAVGSGKSSILEAIVFVLYGKSDRLNEKNDNRYYNMLNLQSDELMLDFIFMAGQNNAEQYRFRFLAKRSKKDFEKVEVKERNYYQWNEGEWLPLEGISDAAAIIGMNHQNFMQTIIIPQGKFKEFVDRTAGERTKMLKELFHLDRFDLSQKTNLLISHNKADIDKLEGRLEELGDVDDFKILQKEEELKQMNALLYEAELKCNANKQEEQKLSILKKLFLQIEEQEGKLQLLQSQQHVFAEKEIKYNAYEKAFTFLKEKIKNRESLLNEIKKTVASLEELNNKKNYNDAQYEAHEQVLGSAKESFDKRDEMKNKCDDLETLIKLKTVKEKLADLKSIFENQKVHEERITKEYNQLKNTISEKETALTLAEDIFPDVSELQQVYIWFQRKEDIAKEVGRQKENVDVNLTKINSLENEKTRIFSNGKSSLSLDEIASFIKQENERAEGGKNIIEEEIQSLQVQQKLAEYSNTLESGKPCPLCGSLDHPAVTTIHNVDDKINIKQEALNKILLQIKEYKLQESQLQKLSIELTNQSDLLKAKKQEYEAAANKLILHQQSFKWKKYSAEDPTEVEEKLKAFEVQTQNNHNLKSELKKHKEEAAKREDLYLKSKDQIQQLHNEVCSEEARSKTYEDQLKQLQYEKYEKYQILQLKESLQKGVKQLAATEKNYDEAINQHHKLKMEQQMLAQQISFRTESQSQMQVKLNDLEDSIGKLLEEKGFESMDHVNKILALAINLEKEKRDIELFHRELHSTKNALEKHFEEAAGHNYDEVYHKNLISQLDAIETQVKELKKEFDVQEHEIVELQKRLNIKSNCKKELDQLLLRSENLKELRKLFMGSGFVRYVSTIYLQDLCKAANQRFFKLTQNNLSLELNQDEEFIVRDYLNNGKTRLLKTLSGGQTFQAALCLALALAENVKSLNKAEQSFFFLDEGFGSLDKESLRIVFDTLKTLRNENRIVGIISHVEELQQEIDVYLKIVNDREKGSIVNYSWK